RVALRAPGRGIALIRRRSSRNPAYQTLAPSTPRRPLPDPDVLLRSPYTRRTRAHIRGGQSGGQENPRPGETGGDPEGQSSSGSEHTRAGAARGGVSGRGVGEEIGQRGRGAGRQRRGRVGRKAEVAQDFAQDVGRLDRGDDGHAAAAPRGHARTSRSKNRRIKSAHFQSRGFSGGFA